MDSHLISVIVPFYNTPKGMMDRCIDSIIKQTNGDLECIIVNDGSKESFADFLPEYEKLDNRIRVLHKTNGGLGSARNYGIENAKGEYVFFIDSDDYISPHTLKSGLEIALKTGADMVVGGLKHVESDEKPVFKKMCKRTVVIQSREEKIKYIFHLSGIKQHPLLLEHGQTGSTACAKLVKRTIANDVRFENDKYWDEDNLWNISFTSCANKIVVADVLWYAYVINSNSMVRGYSGDRMEEFQFRAKQEYQRIQLLWPECMQGAYYHIWDGLLRYCRTDTFQPGNKNSESKKFSDYCRAIEFDEFKEAMERIDFNYERRALHRVVKKTIRKLLLLKNKRFSYLVLGICIRKIKF